MFQFAQLGSLNDPNAKFGRFLAVMNFRDFLHMSASRPNFGHSHRRRLDSKAAVRSASHNGEKLGANRMALPPAIG